VRLAKLTNKCADEHLDFYITQSAEILGVSDRLPEGRRGAKHCLEFILKELVNWKRIQPADTSLNGGVGLHL